MARSTESEAEKTKHPILRHRSVMPVVTCNQIRNELGRGGVLFSRLFVATLGHDK